MDQIQSAPTARFILCVSWVERRGHTIYEKESIIEVRIIIQGISYLIERIVLVMLCWRL